jgi:hypothetical protein
VGRAIVAPSAGFEEARVTRRDSWLPAVLAMVTCGLYGLYWQYVSTSELKAVSGREDLNPTMDLILSLVCCGFYGIYVDYRNTQIVHELFGRAQQQHEDKSQFVVIMWALHFVTGVTGFIAIMVVQDEYNKLGTLGGSPPSTY